MVEVVVRQDDQDRYSWDRIERVYDNGVEIERSTLFDNGSESYLLFSGGIRSRLIQIDYPFDGSVNTWTSIETYYDQSGQIEARWTQYDDGVERIEEFSGGVRARTVQLDNSEDGDAGGVKTWTSIETYYDLSGDMDARVTRFDNGVEKIEEFTGGVRARTVQLDNVSAPDGAGAKVWTSIEAYFDAAGVLEARVTQFDNGIERIEEFAGGLRTKTTQLDNPADYTGTGAKAWSSIETYFGPDGQVEAKVVQYDDGRFQEDLYQNGERYVSRTIDGAGGPDDGAYAWAEKTTVFDAQGDKLAFQTVFDDGDVRVDTFDLGVRVRRSEYDGDGDMAWVGRVVNYDDTGAATGTDYYYALDALPADFAAYPLDFV